MIIVPDFEDALCVGADPLLFDLDAHHHNRLGPFNSCLMCDDAALYCQQCPIMAECLGWGRKLKSSGLIWGGHAFDRGRPKKLRVRELRQDVIEC